MENRRTIAQDAAKGLMIIGVVFFHCSLMTYAVPMEALSQFNILSAMFPFIMSSFFFYTGYNYVDKGRSYKESILRRAKQLLIPMAIAFIISAITISSIELIYSYQDVPSALHAIGNTILYSLMSEPLAIMIGFPQSGGTVLGLVVGLGLLWFIYCLFTCSIFFYLLVKRTNKNPFTLFSVVIILLIIAFVIGEYVGTYLPYTIQCYPVVLAIMLTAAYLRQSHFLNKRIRTKKDIIFHTINALIAEGIIIATCFVMYYRFNATTTGALPGGLFDTNLKGFDAFIAYAFGILGTYFIHTVCRLIKRIPILGTSLAWVGNHSAFFYLFHPIFITLIMSLIFKKEVILGAGQAYVYFAFTFACLVLCCFIIDLIIKRKHIATPIKEEIDNNKDPEGD